jgi:hypothetical protein
VSKGGITLKLKPQRKKGQGGKGGERLNLSAAREHYRVAKRAEVKKANPQMLGPGITKIIQQQWKILGADEKKIFHAIAEEAIPEAEGWRVPEALKQEVVSLMRAAPKGKQRAIGRLQFSRLVREGYKVSLRYLQDWPSLMKAKQLQASLVAGEGDAKGVDADADDVATPAKKKAKKTPIEMKGKAEKSMPSFVEKATEAKMTEEERRGQKGKKRNARGKECKAAKKRRKEQKASSFDQGPIAVAHNGRCQQCGVGGELLCCDQCNLVYHMSCLDPPLKRLPKGDWFCAECSTYSDSSTDEFTSDSEEEGGYVVQISQCLI